MSREDYKKYLESKSWKELRRKARERAKNECELCGGAADCVHHIKYPKNLLEDELSNLLVCCRKCHEKQHGIKDGGEKLLIKVIKKRINYPRSDEEYEEITKGLRNDYHGFNMSGYGLGDDERTFEGREVCRMNNWALFNSLFKDYMPKDFGIDKFRLRCWKGSVWWGDDDYNYDDVEEFSGWESWKIMLWIIKIYGKYAR